MDRRRRRRARSRIVLRSGPLITINLIGDSPINRKNREPVYALEILSARGKINYPPGPNMREIPVLWPESLIKFLRRRPSYLGCIRK